MVPGKQSAFKELLLSCDSEQKHRHLVNGIQDGSEEICVVVGAFVLQNRHQPFQSHSGIHVVLWQGKQIPLHLSDSQPGKIKGKREARVSSGAKKRSRGVKEKGRMAEDGNSR